MLMQQEVATKTRTMIEFSCNQFALQGGMIYQQKQHPSTQKIQKNVYLL